MPDAHASSRPSFPLVVDCLEADRVRGRRGCAQRRRIDRRDLPGDELDSPGSDLQTACDGCHACGRRCWRRRLQEHEERVIDFAGRSADSAVAFTESRRADESRRDSAARPILCFRMRWRRSPEYMAVWIEDEQGQVIASSGPANLIAAFLRRETINGEAGRRPGVPPSPSGRNVRIAALGRGAGCRTQTPWNRHGAGRLQPDRFDADGSDAASTRPARFWWGSRTARRFN